MDKNIFQKIMAGDIPATFEYADDKVVVIRDIAPHAPLHLLIIPRKPIRNIEALEAEDAPLVGHIFLVAREMARKFGVNESGYRIVTNAEADAGQTVFHLHFHLLGGKPLGGMVLQGAAPASAGAKGSGMLLEAGLVIVLAIGLAIGFNTMNPKKIAWVKPTFDTQQATANDLERYLGTPATDDPVAVPAAPIIPATTATKTDTATLVAVNTPAVKPGMDPAAKPVPDVKPADTAKPRPCFTAQPGVIREIDMATFKKLLASPCMTLIDGRIPESYAKGHVNGAININGTEAESPEQIMKLMALPKDRIILVYCDGGECELSHRIAEVLKNFGFGPMFIYTGGWAEWSKQGK